MKRFCVTPYHNLYKNGEKCQFNRRAVSETVIQNDDWKVLCDSLENNYQCDYRM